MPSLTTRSASRAATTPKDVKQYASQRPDEVEMGVEVMHVWDVDLKLCLFSLEMCVYTRWRCPDDEAEQALQEGGDGLDESWEPEWYPRLKVWNMATELTERPKELRI